MIQIDGSIVIQIINFVFLICILNILLFKPIRKVLLQRKEKISGLEKSIQASERDATEKDEAFLNGIKLAREKGLKERESFLNSAAEDEKKIIDVIHKKTQVELITIREKITKDAERAQVALQAEVDDFAKAIGQKVLGRAVE